MCSSDLILLAARWNLEFARRLRSVGRHAACAGFDGFTVDGDNYYNSAMDYRIAREKSQSINQYVIDTLERLAGTLTLEFLTDSKYVK